MKICIEKKWIHLPLDIAALRLLLQKIGLLVFMPVSFMGAVWVVSLDDGRVMLLPLVGILVLFSGGLFGLVAAQMLGMTGKQKGVMYCSGAFTNIGAIGGLVCFMFLGEKGFALVALYKMFEEMSYYIVGFPFARYLGGKEKEGSGTIESIIRVMKDPFVATIFCAFCIGMTLNLMSVQRPAYIAFITAFSVPVGTFILIFSIGLGMRFTQLKRYYKPTMAVSLIKFICTPMVGCSLAYVFGLHQVDNGLPFKVVAILSSMPVAFNTLVAASIFDLDLDLANSNWLVTTSLLTLVLPFLYFVLL